VHLLFCEQQIVEIKIHLIQFIYYEWTNSGFIILGSTNESETISNFWTRRYCFIFELWFFNINEILRLGELLISDY